MMQEVGEEYLPFTKELEQLFQVNTNCLLISSSLLNKQEWVSKSM
jgi:hypothetical protein